MRTLSYDLLEGMIAAPQEEEEDGGGRRLAHAVQLVYENELTGRQKKCVELCVLQGMHTTEAARQLGISPQAVSHHVKAAKRRMARVLRYCMVMLP